MNEKVKSGLNGLLIGVLILAFVMAGGAKLAGVEMVHQSFKNMGLPVVTGYLVGLLEVIAAVLLLVAKYRWYAALALALTMVGAAGYHFVFDPLPASVPAIVLLVLSALVVRQGRTSMAS